MSSEMTEIAYNHLKKDYLVQSEMIASVTHTADLNGSLGMCIIIKTL